MSRPFLPYGRQLIEEDDMAAVAAVLKSGYLTGGPAVTAFETALAEHTGAAHAAALSSGTAALHLAALALGLKKGDVVIVPSLTFLATANAVRYVGADVVFADVDEDTGLLTAATTERAIAAANGRARAVFPVHLNGQTADMAAISETARTHDLKIVEDACHAIGGRHQGPDGTSVPVGSCAFSDITVFSFHPVKTIAMGEGGAVTCNNEKLSGRIKRLRNHGMTKNAGDFKNNDLAFDKKGEQNPWYYEMQSPGFNYRASDIHCALGLSQLKKLDRFKVARSQRMQWYRDALATLAPLVRPLPVTPGCDPSWHLCAVHIDFKAAGKERGAVMNRMKQLGVGTQVHYLPVHRQPYYGNLYPGLSLPGADAYYHSILSLPLFVEMTKDDVEFVVASLARALEWPRR